VVPALLRSRFVRLAGRPYAVTGLALVALAATYGSMVAFRAAATLGAVAFAPWVGLIGFDAGVWAGVLTAGGSVGLWLLAGSYEDVHVTGTQIAVRVGYLALLGAGTAVAGRRLLASERALSSVAALQTSLLDAALDGICLTDRSGNILISNAPLRRLTLELGLPLVGTVPERLLAIAPRITDQDRYRRRMIELAQSSSESTSDEFELAGTGRVFRGFTAPVADASGGFAGRIWTLREVTADRELDRMRDAFVATVSHELRTPLTSISGFLEMMQDEEEGLGETGRTYLGVIRRSTERLHQLVEDLLLIAQIEAHRVELDYATVDLAELAERCVEAVRPAAAEKSIELEIATDHPPVVNGDRHRLTQVLDNLVSNAVKFTDGGGKVTVSIAANGDSARLVVADTGIGIPAGELAQVFSRFFRASTATQRAIPGTGLGLAISRALVEQHGGTISLESSQDEGTCVTVTLPTQRPEQGIRPLVA
jgi:signal transduction histidine kinase